MVLAIAVDPTDATHWLIGAAEGGLWETRDAGTTWTPKTDAEASLAIGAIAFAPSDPRIIYAGTGDPGFSFAGAGLLKSTDGGATWTLLAPSTFARRSFSAIKVHPTSPDIALAATTEGFRVSLLPSPPPTGIFKSTDGGVTWSPKLFGRGTDLAVDPTNFNRVYAGIGNDHGSDVNGVYRSTDGGESWAFISGPWMTALGGVGRVALALAPSDPNVLYVSIQDAFDGVGTDGGLLGLWRTGNAWAATPVWTQIPTGATDDGTGVHGYCGWDLAFNSATDQCWFNHVLIVDPTNANILYAGGIPLWKFDGSTWTEISKQASDPTHGIHVDQHALAWAGTRLIVGNDGGVWSTPDGGATWADHNTNLALTQFYAGSLHPTDPNFALAGSQDNGTEKWTGTTAWQQIQRGDGAANAIASANPNTHWAVSRIFLTIDRTTDGGASFAWVSSAIDTTTAPFISQFAKCPANDNVFIAGTDKIWRTNNFFSSSPGDPTWTDNGSGPFSSGISALAFAPLDATCSTYAFGTGAGSLRLTANGGTTWVNIDAANAVPNRYVTGLAFDPTNSNVLYVTLSGFDEGTPGQPGHVFKTTNALAASPTWANVSPPVNIPHDAVALDPSSPSIVYVGTDLGVWKSPDGGATWAHMGPETGMPNVAAFDLKINATTGRLVAFTHGRGAFALTTLTQVGAITGQAFADVNGNGVKDAGELGAPGRTVFLDTNNNGVLDPGEPRTTTDATGSYSFTTLAPGTYTVRVVDQAGLTPTSPTGLTVMVAGGTAVSGINFGHTLPFPKGAIATGAGPGGGSHVRAFDGTGRPAATSFLAYPAGFTGGAFVAVANLDGIGDPQIITGAGAGGGSHVRAFNADGSPRGGGFLAYAAGFTGGVRVAACDFDRDGRADIVTGAGPGGGPQVRVIKLDGAGNPVADLASFFAYDAAFTGGVFVACADVDGTGAPDIITGADAGGGADVRVFRLQAGAPGGVVLILEFFAYAPGFTGGVRVAAGNVDGSDRASIIVGAGPGGGPHVRVLKFTGGALQELASFLAYAPGFTGGVYVATGNISGDGHAKVITGAGPGGGPHVRVFTGSGADTGISVMAYDPGFTGGVTVAASP